MASIPVDVTLADGTVETTTLVVPDPAKWAADDARRFVWDVWRLLLTAAGESLQLREIAPYGSWRLEFVADTGAAVTGPLHLSNRALEWLQSAVFRLPSRSGSSDGPAVTVGTAA